MGIKNCNTNNNNCYNSVISILQLEKLFNFLFSISVIINIAVTDASSMRMSKDSQNKLPFLVGGVFNRSSFETYRNYEDSLDNLQGSSIAIQSPVILQKYPPSQVMFESLNPYRLMMQYCEPSSSLAKNTIAILATCDHDIVSFLTMIGSQLYMPVISLSDRDWTFSFKGIHPMFLRLVAPRSSQTQPIIEFLKQFGLYTIAVVTSYDKENDGFINAIESQTIFSPKDREKWKLQTVQVNSYDVMNVSLSVKELRNNGFKVFIVHSKLEDARIIMEKAEQLNLLSSGYAWFLTEELQTQYEKSDQDMNKLPEGIISVKYVNTQTTGEKFQLIVKLIQQALSELSPDKREHLQRATVLNNCDPNVDVKTSSTEFYERLKNATTADNKRIFTDAGDLAIFQYEILNLQSSLIKERKEWKKVGEFVNGRLSSFQTVVWPGRSFQTPREGTDMGSVRVTAKVTAPFVEVLKTEDKNWECYSASRCLRPNTHDKWTLIKLFDETSKYHPSMYDQLLPNKKTFDQQNKTKIKPKYELTQDMLQCCSGLMVDFLNQLKQDLDFHYYLYIVDKNKPGSKKNGSWDGMVRDLINGAADLAIGAFSITKERSEVIDFTTPFFHSGFSIMVARNKPLPKADAFLAPLSWEVWILVVVCVHVVALCITAFEWLSPYGLTPLGRNRDKVFSWPSALVHTWSMLFSHTFPSKAPKCWSARWLVNIWGCFSFVFIASYTANLAAFMAGIMQHLQVENIYSPIFQSPDGSVKFATVNGSSTYNYIKLNWDRMHKFMKDYNTDTISESISLVKRDMLDAFIYDSPIITYEVATDSDCRLLTVGAPFGGEGYGIGLPKGSHLNKAISTLIQNYTSGTFMEELMDKWFRGAGSKGCFKPTRNEQVGLGLNHAMGLFFFFSCGVIFAFICLMFEIFTYKWLVPYMRTKPHNSKWRDLMVYSQRLHRAVNKDEHITAKEMLKNMFNMVKQRQFSRVMFKEDLKRRGSTISSQSGSFKQKGRRGRYRDDFDLAATAADCPSGSNDRNFDYFSSPSHHRSNTSSNRVPPLGRTGGGGHHAGQGQIQGQGGQFQPSADFASSAPNSMNDVHLNNLNMYHPHHPLSSPSGQGHTQGQGQSRSSFDENGIPSPFTHKGVSTIINGPQTLPHMPKGGGGKYSPVIPEHFLTSPHHSMGSPSRAHPNFYPLNSIPHSGSSSSPNYLQGNPSNPSSHIPLHEMDSNPGNHLATMFSPVHSESGRPGVGSPRSNQGRPGVTHLDTDPNNSASDDPTSNSTLPSGAPKNPQSILKKRGSASNRNNNPKSSEARRQFEEIQKEFGEKYDQALKSAKTEPHI